MVGHMASLFNYLEPTLLFNDMIVLTNHSSLKIFLEKINKFLDLFLCRTVYPLG